MSTNKLFLHIGVGALALAATVAQATTINVKTGAWESTTTTTTTGMMIPSDMLAKLPPERRAAMEQAMRARSGQPRTHTHKYCVAQKDLDEDQWLKKQDGNHECSQKVLSKSSTKVELTTTCGTAPQTMTMHMTVEATNPENVVMTGDGQMQGGGKTHIEGRSHWLGASCAGITKD